MKKLLPIVLALAFLTACSPASAPSSAGGEFAALQGAVNLERQSLPSWTEEEKALAAPPAEFASTLTDDEVEELLTPRAAASAVTPQESAADVDLFFRALRSAYGAYWYFGGDEVFLPVKDAVLAELADKPPLTAASVGRILRKHMASVIRDGCFAIDGAGVWSDNQFMYYVPELYFAQGDADAADYIRPTIGPGGEITYCFAALSPDGQGLPAAATVAGEEKTLNWVKAEAYAPDSKPAYEKADNGGLPTLVCRTLSEAEDAQGVEALIAAAPQWQEELCFIIDVRGNGGGENANAVAWFNAYADSDAPTKDIRLLNSSRLLSAYRQTQSPYSGGNLMDRVAANAGTWTANITDGGQVPNDSLIFVLQDGKVTGTGECFLKYLSTLENVILVGSNTAGDYLVGDEMEITLPKTGVKVCFGGSLDLFRTVDLAEGVGLPPDLWVPPQDAPDAVARLVRYYGLMA